MQALIQILILTSLSSCRVTDLISGVGNIVTGVGGNVIQGNNNFLNALDQNDIEFLKTLMQDDEVASMTNAAATKSAAPPATTNNEIAINRTDVN